MNGKSIYWLYRQEWKQRGRNLKKWEYLTGATRKVWTAILLDVELTLEKAEEDVEDMAARLAGLKEQMEEENTALAAQVLDLQRENYDVRRELRAVHQTAERETARRHRMEKVVAAAEALLEQKNAESSLQRAPENPPVVAEETDALRQLLLLKHANHNVLSQLRLEQQANFEKTRKIADLQAEILRLKKPSAERKTLPDGSSLTVENLVKANEQQRKKIQALVEQTVILARQIPANKHAATPDEILTTNRDVDSTGIVTETEEQGQAVAEILEATDEPGEPLRLGWRWNAKKGEK